MNAWVITGIGFLGGEDWLRVLFLQDHNTRTVVFSTAVLGWASGLVGTFLLLRKRSLMGDALSHACLPGMVIAFWVSVALGGMGKSLPVLLLGAFLAGLVGVVVVLVIRNTTRIKDDAAMGIVLSVFFGMGVVLLSMVQQLPQASAAGLEGFLYGKTAAMLRGDFFFILGVAAAVVGLCLLLLKEWTLLCFDEGFGHSLGWPMQRLDAGLLGLAAVVVVMGMQAVGLILVIAFLIIPAAAARFWTHRLVTMLWTAGVVGAISGWIGATLSALTPGMPAGAVIVLVAAFFFVLSLAFGPAHGVVPRALDQWRLSRKVGRQHLLRAVFELLETSQRCRPEAILNRPVSIVEVVGKRSWSADHVHRLIRQAAREDHLDVAPPGEICLSESGFGEAARTVRNHRLWEIFLISYADIAPSHVDRDADAVEHMLSPQMVRELEEKLGPAVLPPSPHPLGKEGCG